MAVVPSVSDAPTPRQTGSYMRAVGFRAVCDNIAAKASEAARLSGRSPGRPDLRFVRLARRARALSAHFHGWTLTGIGARFDVGERGADMKAYETLLTDSRALGVEPLG